MYSMFAVKLTYTVFYIQAYVEGERCDRCKPGYFFLDRDNPDGCTECYCSGVSHNCVEASGYRLHEVCFNRNIRIK